MINLVSVTKEHVERESRRIGIQDSAVLERTIHAFLLLERLALSRMDFLFKGGTSLILLLEPPKRVSVDIDIICQVPRKEFENELKAELKTPRFQNQFGILDRLKGNMESYWYWCEAIRLLKNPNLIPK